MDDQLDLILRQVTAMNDKWATMARWERFKWDDWADVPIEITDGVMRITGDAKFETGQQRATRRDRQREEHEKATRAAPFVQAYLEGKTLREIGMEHHMTGEGVRLILVKAGIHKEDRGTIARERAEQAKQERIAAVATPIREFLVAQGPTHYCDLLAEFPQTTMDEVKQWARGGVLPIHLLLADPQDWVGPGFSDEDLLDAIKAAVGRRGYSKPPISKDEYDRLRLEGDPSGVLISCRLGWRDACAQAGFGIRPERRKYDREWTDETLLMWVWVFVEHAGATGTTNSFNKYESWAKVTEGAPSGAQVRIQMKRFRGTSSWPAIVKMAAAEWRGNVSSP